MFSNPTRPFRPGEPFKASFEFEKIGKVEVAFEIRSIKDKPTPHEGHGMQGPCIDKTIVLLQQLRMIIQSILSPKDLYLWKCCFHGKGRYVLINLLISFYAINR